MRGYRIADALRARGIPVVVGGMHFFLLGSRADSLDDYDGAVELARPARRLDRKGMRIAFEQWKAARSGVRERQARPPGRGGVRRATPWG